MDNEPLDTGPLLRYALIGAGASIASNHLDALARLPGTQIVGMADVVPTIGAQRAATVGWPVSPARGLESGFALLEDAIRLGIRIGADEQVCRAAVNVARQNGHLKVEITDDGVGGADTTRGTGLAGLADRVTAVDGTIRISSPVGGPTILTVELPCAS